ncbi:MAG: hypothetical protein EZS28_051733 [Streblomastix strix]|uniref:Uncharacterized protein n=1 Tax=Streblomastix strix TaxID=222440 RepID=A0A5J4T5J0_9EUKA|nr:MAG: hypothetical protein EZS28_051733 [Streblomastix strix]
MLQQFLMQSFWKLLTQLHFKLIYYDDLRDEDHNINDDIFGEADLIQLQVRGHRRKRKKGRGRGKAQSPTQPLLSRDSLGVVILDTDGIAGVRICQLDDQCYFVDLSRGFLAK